ncbi:hypothetical protein [Sphingomonas azotifigens]|uniref:hypothetical protein n=1 Tax=Sphingomonas azotifigens TaxID=330920 RepID=UPI001431DF7C|nr:hypothetical protein [Sphingomonas azotifigens]
MAATDSATMGYPIEATGACHQKYHQLAGMQWHFASLIGRLISPQTAENSQLWNVLECPGKAFW